MDSPSSQRVAAVRHARKGTRLMAERISEESWRLLNVANESFNLTSEHHLGIRRFEQDGLFIES